MPITRRRVTDAGALKALAHPVRLGILELLVTQGPLTATEAGRLLDETPANCSWHLRRLAEHGFVREAPSRGGRSRPWRAVSEGLTWEDGDEDPELTAAGEALSDMLLERELQRFRAARASAASEPQEWREVTHLNQSRLWLTADEARALSEELAELFLRHAERLNEPEKRPEDARLVSLVGWLAPSGPLRDRADRAER